ncbi:hypothetical protein M0802_000848 [Mischocyttarus mexicanus]|nr:hypothetical protein M0802_000848 [Mischocyttarus mexicanus]
MVLMVVVVVVIVVVVVAAAAAAAAAGSKEVFRKSYKQQSMKEFELSSIGRCVELIFCVFKLQYSHDCLIEQHAYNDDDVSSFGSQGR